MKKITFIIFIFLISIPALAHADIIINEIAWMGTNKSSSDEWIELANTDSTAVSLIGWKLHTADNSVNITLSGSISGNGFYLLERTDDTTIPTITADKIYTGALSDSGEKLILEDNTGSVVQSLDFTAKWPAGNTTTNQTMQWNGSSWVTGDPTPKAANVQTTADTNTTTTNTTTNTSNGTQQYVPPKVVPHIEFSFPTPLYSGMQYDFGAQAVLEYMTQPYGYFVWNMGDGSHFTKTENTEPLAYIYEYPGTYTVSFAYYRSAYEKKPILSGTKKIEVFKPSIDMSVIDNGVALSIQNSTDKVVDLSGWHLETNSGNTIFPDMTYIAPKASVVFSAKNLQLTSVNGAKIYTPFSGFSTQVIQPSTIPNVVIQHTTTKPGKKYTTHTVLSDTAQPIQNVSTETTTAPQAKNHTKSIILGVVIATVIGLLLLLERFMTQKE